MWGEPAYSRAVRLRYNLPFTPMALIFRLATPADYQPLEELVLAAFEPITWLKKADERFGPLNGRDWRARWKTRFFNIFETQIVLIGEDQGEIVAIASGTIDRLSKLGYIDLLGIAQRHQGKGYGREMLRGMLRHLKEQGAVHAHLECLTTNEVGNKLYRSEGWEEVAHSIRWFIKIP